MKGLEAWDWLQTSYLGWSHLGHYIALVPWLVGPQVGPIQLAHLCGAHSTVCMVLTWAFLNYIITMMPKFSINEPLVRSSSANPSLHHFAFSILKTLPHISVRYCKHHDIFTSPSSKPCPNYVGVNYMNSIFHSSLSWAKSRDRIHEILVLEVTKYRKFGLLLVHVLYKSFFLVPQQIGSREFYSLC